MLIVLEGSNKIFRRNYHSKNDYQLFIQKKSCDHCGLLDAFFLVVKTRYCHHVQIPRCIGRDFVRGLPFKRLFLLIYFKKSLCLLEPARRIFRGRKNFVVLS